MAILDSQAIFSRDQVIDAVTYSQRAMDLQSLADYGVGANAYIECVVNGAFTKYLRVQLVGSASDDWADLIVISDSGVKDKSELVAGHVFYVPFTLTDKRYKNICLRFIPSDDAASNDSSATPEGTAYALEDGYAAPPKVGVDKTEVANSISCHLVLTPTTHVEYDTVNEDKFTA